MKKNVGRSKKVSFKISYIYLLSSIFWIYTTEWILTKFDTDDVFWISIVKGILFVIATGLLLYKFIQRNIKDIEDREQQLNSLIENNMDAIIHLDLNGMIISVNDVTGKITGYSEEELTKMSFKELISKEDMDKVQKHFLEIGKGKSSIIECKCMIKSGHCILVSMKSVPIVIEDKKVGIFVIVRDITELKDKEELIRKSEKLSIVGELAAATAHEIRNPLTSIKGFLQLLQYKDSKDEEKHYYNIMLSEIERINLIVSEFMVLSKPQAITYQNEKITSLLKDVLTLIETIAIVKNIEVTKEFEPNIILVKCEGNQIKQVFINVFKNAIEAVPNKGKIYIKVTQLNKDCVRIRFIDNGPGIPNDLLSRLGEPFYTTKEKGTGLGLMVSYKIIEDHGGRINIKSEMNKGTTVDIILPVSIVE
ncbi:PAS domain S-box protein [Bacillus sp. V3B]|uniref:ATP-binding protein n=1 Tax=Bacillus sp. V3B TaxID=2804915 RepID=UPI00210F1E11|nr:ATP-binding protein [Bacillus sp. V3B]MCQ6277243.1 PAS domain S-box protein [Bacillus sp. V3B]